MRDTPLPFLFACTLFVSAVLLFWIQPLVAKMLLPLLGGTPSVWNVCMVFYQGVLLAGYAYAHCVTQWCGRRRQIMLHVILLLAALALLPVGVTKHAVDSLAGGANPVGWLIGTLLVAVGFPFFVVSSTAPLLQKWFAHSRHRLAQDPYFLYAASNLGSLAALLCFPVVLEPLVTTRLQSRLWMGLFSLLALLIGVCGWTAWRAGKDDRGDVESSPHRPATTTGLDVIVNWRRRLRWVLWAFIPSSLMLGVTQYLTTDIATFPLLWVIPLALYLCTFILVFARQRVVSDTFLRRALPALAVVLLFLVASKATQPIWLLMFVHLLFFFVAAMCLHGLLANDRPPVSHLTEFYFWMSGGGVLGGVFNALLAPVLFNRIIEYPLGMLLACLAVGMAQSAGQGARIRWIDVALPMGLLALVWSLDLAFGQGLKAPVQVRNVVVFGLPLVLAFFASNHPVRFALSLGAILIGAGFCGEGEGRTIAITRNFFGVSRVTVAADGRFRQLYHGNTVHGRQFIQADRQSEPLSYYHRTGPLGQIFQAFNTRPASAHVAMIGLGAGATVCYLLPGQTGAIYEIDPGVVRLASNTNHFTYLGQGRGAPPQIILGDARLQLRGAPDGKYGLMVLDAFSSDAIPVHLLTREALQLYAAKLAPGGLLAFHISNRNLDLKPVIADLADAEHLICLSRDDVNDTDPEYINGKDPSQWVVMARRQEDLGGFVENKSWQRLQPNATPKPWTDDFSNLLMTLRWR